MEVIVNCHSVRSRLVMLQPRQAWQNCSLSLPKHSLIYTGLVQMCVCFDGCLCVLMHPSRFDSESPYQMLDTFHWQIQEREAVMGSLVESASLFEVTISEYKQLRQCR